MYGVGEDKQDKEILTFMKDYISLRKRYSEFKLVIMNGY